MLSIQYLDYTPELTARSLSPRMSAEQYRALAKATSKTFIVRRDERVVCMFGIIDGMLLAPHVELWFGLIKGERLTRAELLAIRPTLDTLMEYYGVELRAAIDRGNPVHNKFAKFCGFTPFAEIGNFTAYERGA